MTDENNYLKHNINLFVKNVTMKTEEKTILTL